MATYSNIGIKLITTGGESGTWGASTNTNFSDILDEAIAGVTTFNISSDADFTLTVSDGSSSDARHAVIAFTSVSLSAARTCTLAPNSLQKVWIVINATTGGQDLIFKQGSAGATVTVPNGESAVIFTNGAGATNGAVFKALDSFTNSKITTGILNATTLDLTNLEVTNVKAKDGTLAFTIADVTGKVNLTTELDVDNLNFSGNAIISTNTNGDIDLTPNGSGEVNISKVDIDSGAIDATAIGAGSPSTGAFTDLTASGTINFTGATVSDGGSVTTIDINGGTIDGTTIGSSSASPGTFTNLTATGTINFTGATISNGGSVTTIDINGGTIDGTAIGSSAASTGAFTTLSASGTTTLSALTASTALALNASKEIVSVTNTGTGNNVLATSPILTTPNLGTPSAVTLTNATGLPVSTGISGLGANVATFLATPSSSNLAAAVTDETGSGALVFANSPALTTPNLGTPSALTLTNATGLPTAGLVDNAVTDAKLRDSVALSVIGRSANSTGDPADIAAATDHQVLRRSGTAIGFGAIALNQSAAVTGVLPVVNGGSGQSSFVNGELLIGNTTGNTLTKATLTAGTGITVTNGTGSITVATNNQITGGAPVTATANYTVAAGVSWIINNKTGSALVVTLPTASTNTGRQLTIQTYQNQTVVSNASNVVPLGGGSAGTAILPAISGSHATLVSDGTNWITMTSRTNNSLMLE
jgi:hypothetical protein